MVTALAGKSTFRVLAKIDSSVLSGMLMSWLPELPRADVRSLRTVLSAMDWGVIVPPSEVRCLWTEGRAMPRRRENLVPWVIR